MGLKGNFNLYKFCTFQKIGEAKDSQFLTIQGRLNPSGWDGKNVIIIRGCTDHALIITFKAL